jgi:hypothetical protein
LAVSSDSLTPTFSRSLGLRATTSPGLTAKDGMLTVLPATFTCPCKTSWRAVLSEVAMPMRRTTLSSRSSSARSRKSPEFSGLREALATSRSKGFSVMLTMRRSFCFSRRRIE